MHKNENSAPSMISPTFVDVPMHSLLDVVVTSTCHVAEVDTDQFVHLNFGDMQRLIIRHRIRAIEKDLGLTKEAMAHDGVGYVVSEQYSMVVRPSHVGDELLFASWIDQLAGKAAIVRCVVMQKDQDTWKNLVAASCFSICAVDCDGHSVPFPETFSSIRKDVQDFVSRDENQRDEVLVKLGLRHRLLTRLVQMRQLTGDNLGFL